MGSRDGGGREGVEGVCRALHETGYTGALPIAPRAVEGCLGVIAIGDMTVYEYSVEKGFYRPPGGLVDVEVSIEESEYREMMVGPYVAGETEGGERK